MLQIEGLHFGYGRETLFSGLELALSPGNIYGLLGINGVGKSTLLKLLAGLLFPRRGSVRCAGRDPARRSPDFLARIFMLPEELHLPRLTERQYLSVYAPFYPAFDHAGFERYAGEFELPRGTRLTELSLGQKKKFALAFGLACRSELLLMDEPTNGLDIPSKGQFRRIVAEALTEDRLFVISTHQVREVASLIDPIIILHQGRVLLNESVASIARRVRMQRSATRPAAGTPGLLHCEPGIDGYWSVWRQCGADDGAIDLEVLFNTVLSRPEVCRGLFDTRAVA
jgi:ABC-2 type transport system ATP-binding protein